MIQLRNVPDSLHRQLKALDALAGMALSDFLIREVRNVAEISKSRKPRATQNWRALMGMRRQRLSR
jgi:antitoxin FitA